MSAQSEQMHIVLVTNKDGAFRVSLLRFSPLYNKGIRAKSPSQPTELETRDIKSETEAQQIAKNYRTCSIATLI